MPVPHHPARHRSTAASGPAPAGATAAASPERAGARHRDTRPGSALRRAGLGLACAGAAAALIVPLTSAALPDAGQTAVHVLARAGVGAEKSDDGGAGGTGAVGSGPTARPVPQRAEKADQHPAAEKNTSAATKATGAKAPAKTPATPQERAGLTAPLSASTMTSPFG